MPNPARGIGYALLTLAACLAGAGCGGVNLEPSTQVIPVQNASRTTVPIGNGRTVEIWHGRSAASSDRGAKVPAYVLYFGTSGQRAEQALADARAIWEAHPVEIWAVNYPGFGGSTGPATFDAIPPAALGAFDALQREAAGRPVFVGGNTLGAAVALGVAARRPSVAGLFLRAAPPLGDVVANQYGWWNMGIIGDRMAGQIPAALDSVANGRQVDAPAVFVILGEDEVIARPYQRKVTGAFRGEKRVVVDETAHHADALGAGAERRLAAAIRWLWTRAVPRPPRR